MSLYGPKIYTVCVILLFLVIICNPSFSCIGTSQAAKFLRANGITLFKVREETVDLLGKSDLYFFSPEHPPLTEQAQRVLDWAVDEKLKSGKRNDSLFITVVDLVCHIYKG